MQQTNKTLCYFPFVETRKSNSVFLKTKGTNLVPQTGNMTSPGLCDRLPDAAQSVSTLWGLRFLE